MKANRTFISVISSLVLVFCFASTSQAMTPEGKKEAQQNIEYLFKKVTERMAIKLPQDPEFLPFGAGMDMNGKVNFIFTDRKHQYTAEAAMLLVRQAQLSNADAGRLLGVATIYRYAYKDEKGNDKEQINVEMEYVNGYAMVRAIEVIEQDGKKMLGRSGDKEFEAKIFRQELVEKLKANNNQQPTTNNQQPNNNQQPSK